MKHFLLFLAVACLLVQVMCEDVAEPEAEGEYSSAEAEAENSSSMLSLASSSALISVAFTALINGRL